MYNDDLIVHQGKLSSYTVIPYLNHKASEISLSTTEATTITVSNFYCHKRPLSQTIPITARAI